LDAFFDFVSRLFTHPQAVEISIRLLSVVGTGIGLRVFIRWGTYVIKPGTKKDKVRMASRHMIVPSQIAISIFTSWVYRHQINYEEVFANGERINALILTAMRWETIIGEGVLYGFGSIAVYAIFVALIKTFEKKYNFKIMEE